MLLGVFAVLTCLPLATGRAQDKGAGAGAMKNLADHKLVAFPGLPACTLGAVESGDPAKGPSVIVFTAKAGCVIPWHWHTPTEQVMIVKGAAKMEMKDGGHSMVLKPGGFALMPSKHVHQLTCQSACTGFVASDAPFDIHYVDADGKEITPEAALAKKGKAK
jgi:quercetin dioxygenase-like cupin family protein